MIGIVSRIAGVVIVPANTGKAPEVIDVESDYRVAPQEFAFLYSSVNDWDQIEAADLRSLFQTAKARFRIQRATALIRHCLNGLDAELETRVFDDLEELFEEGTSSDSVLGHLLVAPLIDPALPDKLATRALSTGHTVLASTFSELGDLQELLRRLTSIWLGLETAQLRDIAMPKEQIWLTLIETAMIRGLLETHNATEFMNRWNLLSFHISSPQVRQALPALGEGISAKLFPSGSRKEPLQTDIDSAEDDFHVAAARPTRWYISLARARKQIEAIAQCVANGDDARAIKFLDELVSSQTSEAGGDRLALKSLCNIAQLCADMFRIDFERLCLDRALNLNNSDVWTLIQFGDHLKRIGDFAGAIKTLQDAQRFGANEIGKSAEADVYSSQGYHAKAIAMYKEIPNWQVNPKVKTAIADNLRRMGDLDAAEVEYSELVSLFRENPGIHPEVETRALAGLAEVSKQRSDFEGSCNWYGEVLRRVPSTDRAYVYYSLGLCNVQKLMGQFEEAYVTVSRAIDSYPFATEARYVRGAILGLIGRAADGLQDLPEGNEVTSWREWLRRFYRGLLLFKLEQFEEARRDLVEGYRRAVASEEERAIFRMGACLCYLRENELTEAEALLDALPDLHDSHSRYLSMVLKLHSAVQRGDNRAIQEVRSRMKETDGSTFILQQAVDAIGSRDFANALAFEAEALLRLAA